MEARFFVFLASKNPLSELKCMGIMRSPSTDTNRMYCCIRNHAQHGMRARFQSRYVLNIYDGTKQYWYRQCYILSMVDTLGLPGDVIHQAQPVGSFLLAQNA